MTRIIVAGSRQFTDKKLLYDKLDEIISSTNDDIEIVHGNCRGADLLGEMYAIDHHLKVIAFPAYWKMYGKAAGPIRNNEMAKYASKANGILVAFPIGESNGTRNMINIANKYGLEVHVYE